MHKDLWDLPIFNKKWAYTTLRSFIYWDKLYDWYIFLFKTNKPMEFNGTIEKWIKVSEFADGSYSSEGISGIIIVGLVIPHNFESTFFLILHLIYFSQLFSYWHYSIFGFFTHTIHWPFRWHCDFAWLDGILQISSPE